MNDTDIAMVVIVVFTLIVFFGLGVLWIAMTGRRAFREMEHRERLAMIQRGLVPSPESDPAAFEMAVNPGSLGARRSDRWRTAGITFIGLGLGLMVLLSFTAGEPGVGLGVGGAFAILGGALLVNGMQMSRGDDASMHYRQAPSGLSQPPPPPSQPPGGIQQ